MPAFFCGGVYKGLLGGRMKVLVLAFLQRDSVYLHSCLYCPLPQRPM